MSPRRPPSNCSEPYCKRLARHGSRCDEHRRLTESRPSAAARGYGGDWPARRAAFLARNPWCDEPGCGLPATDADHDPPRRVLVELRVADPDADEYLHPKCHPHHSAKTASRDGGFGNLVRKETRRA